LTCSTDSPLLAHDVASPSDMGTVTCVKAKADDSSIGSDGQPVAIHSQGNKTTIELTIDIMKNDVYVRHLRNAKMGVKGAI
jgi:hypothetical protein